MSRYLQEDRTGVAQGREARYKILVSAKTRKERITLANKLRVFKRNPGNIAFCYYRYSSAAQREDSIEQQRNAAHRYAEQHDYIIPPDCEFEDKAITGTTINRPGLLHMLYEIKHKRPAYLIVWKIDRLSRSMEDSYFIHQSPSGKHLMAFFNANTQKPCPLLGTYFGLRKIDVHNQGFPSLP